jgi:hypothetical protein
MLPSWNRRFFALQLKTFPLITHLGPSYRSYSWLRERVRTPMASSKQIKNTNGVRGGFSDRLYCYFLQTTRFT